MKFLRCEDGTQINAAAIESLYTYRSQVMCGFISGPAGWSETHEQAVPNAILVATCESPEIAQKLVDRIAHHFDGIEPTEASRFKDQIMNEERAKVAAAE